MTVYNADPYLREAIDSVMRQSLPDWELIVVENGSSDESPEILRSYADERIHATWLPTNIGRTPALQLALSLARGEYVAVLDADDVSHDERLLKEVSFLDDHPEVVLVGSWAHYLDECGRVFNYWAPPTDRRELYDCFGWANPIVHSSAMYRAAAARSVGGYPDNLAYAQDGGLWLQLAQIGDVGIIGEYLCGQRITSRSLSRSAASRVTAAQDALFLLDYASHRLFLTDGSRAKNREELAIAAFRYGIALIHDGSFASGAKCILGTLMRNPLGLVRNRVTRRVFGLDPSSGGAAQTLLQRVELRHHVLGQCRKPEGL